MRAHKRISLDLNPFRREEVTLSRILSSERLIERLIHPETNSYKTRICYVFLTGKASKRKIFLVREKNIKGRFKSDRLKLPGGLLNLIELDEDLQPKVDLNLRQGGLRENREEGLFGRSRYPVLEHTVVPLGVDFSKDVGALVFYAARLGRYPREGPTYDFARFVDREGDYIAEVAYFKLSKFSSSCARHKTITGKDLVYPETRDIVLGLVEYGLPQKLYFSQRDLVEPLAAGQDVPVAVTGDKDLVIPRRLRKSLLVASGLEGIVKDDVLNTCAVYLALEKGEIPTKGKIILETDLFMDEQELTIDYGGAPAEAFGGQAVQRVIKAVKEHVAENLPSLLIEDMLAKYLVRDA